mgnify:CR=1 FL=1
MYETYSVPQMNKWHENDYHSSDDGRADTSFASEAMAEDPTANTKMVM